MENNPRTTDLYIPLEQFSRVAPLFKEDSLGQERLKRRHNPNLSRLWWCGNPGETKRKGN